MFVTRCSGDMPIRKLTSDWHTESFLNDTEVRAVASSHTCFPRVRDFLSPECDDRSSKMVLRTQPTANEAEQGTLAFVVPLMTSRPLQLERTSVVGGNVVVPISNSLCRTLPRRRYHLFVPELV